MNDNLSEHKTDAELKNAAVNLADYTAAGQKNIILEMQKRGMEIPSPAPLHPNFSLEYVHYPLRSRTFGVILSPATAFALVGHIVQQLIAY